jgi:hypothetical protein
MFGSRWNNLTNEDPGCRVLINGSCDGPSSGRACIKMLSWSRDQYQPDTDRIDVVVVLPIVLFLYCG